MVLALLAFSCAEGRPADAPQAPALVPVPPAIAAEVRLQRITETLDEPVALAFAKGDPSRRLFVVEKGGRIRILDSSGRSLPYLDLASRVSRGSEQGLLGLAFHDDFMKNGRLFVNYTDKKGDTRIVELTVASPAEVPATIAGERELLFVEQPYSNHNGGHLVMTPAGWLLVGLGDGGSGGDPRGYAQNRNSLLGKLIRLDPGAQGAAPRHSILAKGLRNPWRYALDRRNSDLYIGDVGQNRWEEIHVLPLAEVDGKNFGWNILEGAHCFRALTCDSSGLEMPVVEYGHDAGCSVTGGVVYRGAALPKLDGVYFYSDYCTPILRSFRWNRERREVTDHWDWTGTVARESRLALVSSFGEDESGEVYVLGLRGGLWKFAPRDSAPKSR